MQSGYLPGDRISHGHVEARPGRMPWCIEFIDTESRLRKFLRDHAEELCNVHAVLYRCKLHEAAVK